MTGVALWHAFLLVSGASAFHESIELTAQGKAVRQHGSFTQEHLIRSEEASIRSILSELPGTDRLLSAMDGGVALGACKNFKKTATQMSSVSCPDPLRMVGCTCKDKDGEKTGGCGTKFAAGETCSAFTKMDGNITAYARCCHMDWASKFSVKTSEKSGAEDGKGAKISCDKGETLLGCACLPADAPNVGCKHNQVKETSGVASCLATNLKGHEAGVMSQALCAVIPDSSSWETVALTVQAVDTPTNLSCSDKKLQMISCSCGSGVGQCNGGKVVGGKCECTGARCFASARCADIPIPAQNCLWAVWGEWSDCSVSCGKGSRSRVRVHAMLATNGGRACVGVSNTNITCDGQASKHECSFKPMAAVPVHGSSNKIWIMGFVAVVALVAAVGAKCSGAGKKAKDMHEGEDEGEDYSAHQGEGYGGYEGDEQWSEQ